MHALWIESTRESDPKVETSKAVAKKAQKKIWDFDRIQTQLASPWSKILSLLLSINMFHLTFPSHQIWSDDLCLWKKSGVCQKKERWNFLVSVKLNDGITLICTAYSNRNLKQTRTATTTSGSNKNIIINNIYIIKIHYLHKLLCPWLTRSTNVLVWLAVSIRT